jgi:4-methoxybenzoate monooxygenase (O-demethylating)
MNEPGNRNLNPHDWLAQRVSAQVAQAHEVRKLVSAGGHFVDSTQIHTRLCLWHRSRQYVTVSATVTPSGRAESDLDLFSKEHFDDPWPNLAALRAAAPAVWLTRLECWAVAGHADITAAFRDYDTFCSGAGVGLSDFRKEPPWRPPSIILEADPPDHTKARKVLADVLSPVNVKNMKEVFEREADAMVSALIDAGPFDGVSALSEAYPLKVFPDAVGVTPHDRKYLLAYGNMVFNSFGPRNEYFDQGMVDAAQTRAWIMAQCARSALTTDGLGAQIYEASDRGEVTEEEAGLLLRSFLSAGVDTTISAFTAALWALATHPDQWAALKSDPTLARAAFEEAIRFEGPIQTFFRTTTKPTSLGGVEMGAGEKVLLLMAAANRDERKFADPHRFDISRRTVGHVGYGFGIHVCVGQVVARLEGEALLAALARSAKTITVAGEPIRRYNNTLRTFGTLPLELKS